MSSKNVSLRFVPKSIAQMFSLILKPSFVAQFVVNFILLLTYFICADAESKVDEASKVQFICFACDLMLQLSHLVPLIYLSL